MGSDDRRGIARLRYLLPRGQGETKYFRFGDDGIEPLVIYREFHGIRPNKIEISEEFILFHNLFYDQRNNKYMKIDNRGNEEESIIIEEEHIKVLLQHLKQFLAIKEMALAIYFDMDRFSALTIEDLNIDEVNRHHQTTSLAYFQLSWKDFVKR